MVKAPATLQASGSDPHSTIVAERTDGHDETRTALHLGKWEEPLGLSHNSVPDPRRIR